MSERNEVPTRHWGDLFLSSKPDNVPAGPFPVGDQDGAVKYIGRYLDECAWKKVGVATVRVRPPGVSADVASDRPPVVVLNNVDGHFIPQQDHVLRQITGALGRGPVAPQVDLVLHLEPLGEADEVVFRRSDR
jgi:hypothetical protein